VPRILVVDDDDPIRESIRLALELAGIDVTMAESGERAQEACAATTFDGAIVDLLMPGMSGLDTIRALRIRAPGLPVIVISGSLMQGSGATDMLRNAMTLPNIAVLPKPFKLSELMTLARALFALPSRIPAPKPAA
jgi:DNA-binding NtrC family response regulator